MGDVLRAVASEMRKAADLHDRDPSRPVTPFDARRWAEQIEAPTLAGSVVWKFPLRRWSAFVDMPEGARIVSADYQDTEICVWALCDPDAPKVPRYIACVNTGQRVPPPAAKFIATVQMPNGIAWHLFEGHEGVQQPDA